MPSSFGGRQTSVYFWTLPGAEGAVLGSTVVAVETSLTMGCILRTIMKLGEVVVEPEPGVEVLRNRIDHWDIQGRLPVPNIPLPLH